MHQVGFWTSVSIRILQAWNKFFIIVDPWPNRANCYFSLCFSPIQVLARTCKSDSLPQLHLHLSVLCWFSILHVCDKTDFTELLKPFLASIPTARFNLFISLSCWAPTSAPQTPGPQFAIPPSAQQQRDLSCSILQVPTLGRIPVSR